MPKKDMTILELAELTMGRFDRLEAQVENIEKDVTVMKGDLRSMEERLTRKIDQNYIHVNKRIDLLTEKVA